jgi:hypothetical protein
MCKRQFFSRVLMAVPLVLAGTLTTAATTKSSSTADFQVTRVTAFLGSQSRSHIEVSGLISRQALDTPLVPEVNLYYTVERTCHQLAHPGRVLTVEASYEWKPTASWVPVTEVAPNGSGSLLGWSKSYTFALPDGSASAGYNIAACPTGYQGSPLRISSARVVAWPGWNWESPPPGMPTYEFQLHAGSNGLFGAHPRCATGIR